MTKQFTKIIVCEGNCGSPVYAHVEGKWIFESNRMEERMVCQGCGFVQSKEYSKEVLSDDYKEPILLYGGWKFPNESDYEEWKAINSHNCNSREHLIQLDNSFFKDYHNRTLTTRC